MPRSSHRQLNPDKLLMSKWTASAPKNKEKHFMVTKIIEPDIAHTAFELVEMEAVHSRRRFILPWRELRNNREWLQGWL